jgi:hypothetical protein
VPTLTLLCADAAALRKLFEEQLSKGRAFVPGAIAVGELEACDLILEHAGRTHAMHGEAVFVKAAGPGCGVGLQLAPLDAAATAALRAFVDSVGGAQPASAAAPNERASTPLLERVRSLSLIEQQRMAAGGTLAERIALERAFGPNVWESLLSNPRLTTPEVAAIARKGTLPRPLVETIAGHPSWIATPEVQRAMLSNPHASLAVITKVLEAMKRADLLLVPKQTAYPQGVRAAAKKILAK